MLGTTNISTGSMNNLSISLNGTNVLTYDGKTVASIDISLSSLGAAASNHNHDSIYSKLGHTHDGTQYKAGQGISGGYTFVNDGAYDTGMYSDTDGDLYFKRNGVKTAFTDISINGHTHDALYATKSHSHNYLPITGGVMTGTFGLRNMIWNSCGDDAYFGDHSIAGCFCLKGISADTGIAFCKREDQTIYQKLFSDGTTLRLTKDFAVEGSLYEADARVVTRKVVTLGNINQFDKFFTVYNHIIDSTSGVTGLENITSCGLCMTVDRIGTPFQMWYPDDRLLIAKKIKSSTVFNVLQFCRTQSTAPHIDLLWCW